MSGSTEPVEREPLHTRRIEMRGYRRSDGLFEVIGRLIDTKPVAFTPASADVEVPAGQPLHDMWLSLVFDETLTVRAVDSGVDAAPYAICPWAGQQLDALIGLSMTSGWNALIRERLARADNCTHLVGLLGPMATTALQSMSAMRAGHPTPVDAEGRPRKINSCYAYGEGREVVGRKWPEHASPGPSDTAADRRQGS